MMKFLTGNLSLIIMGFAIIVCGTSLVIVSQNVYEKQAFINNMKHDALMTEWEIRALNAELAFLSRPDRLDQLTSAIASSTSPSTADEITVIAPVAYSGFTQQNTSIIPYRKPTLSKPIRVSSPKISSKITPKKQNFNSFLSSLGGDE